MLREEPCAAPPLPADMAAELSGYQWARDKVGESGGVVYRLHGRPGAPDLYLKWGRDAVAEEITAEMVRLEWLSQRLPAPRVEQFVARSGEAWLLMQALPGETAYQALAARPYARPAVVDALAAFMRRLHAILLDDCPFESGHRLRLARARERIDAGLVDEDDFDQSREGWTAQQVWDALARIPPFTADRVVTHGDFSLDNLLLRDGRVTGCIDVGRLGSADRYQDLAILWNDLGEFGPSMQARLLAQYGLAEPDPAKLQFHLLLDELF